MREGYLRDCGGDGGCELCGASSAAGVSSSEVSITRLYPK